MQWKKSLALAMGALTSMATGALASQAAAGAGPGLRSQRARRYVRRRQISLPVVVEAETDQHLEVTVRLGAEKSGLYPTGGVEGSSKASAYPGCESQTTTVRLFGGELSAARDPRTACTADSVCAPEDGTDTGKASEPSAVHVLGADKSATYAEASLSMERRDSAVFVFDFAEVGITKPAVVSVEMIVDPGGEGDLQPCETARLESTLFLYSNEGGRTAIPTGKIDRISLEPQRFEPPPKAIR